MPVLSISDLLEHVRSEERLSDAVLHLTANETVLSPAVRSILSSSLYSRYLLEHHTMRRPRTARLGNFVYRGLDHIAAIEASAVLVCDELFGAKWVEFRCLSGIHAMQTTIASLTRPGDTVMRIATKDGGHFLTETICRLFGRKSCTFVFNRDTHELDVDASARVFKQERPAILYLDAMNYLFPFPVRALREVMGNVPIVYDASHTLGLIAGGQFQNPLAEGADILQANTHKTFFGPQKGIILSNNEDLMERINYALSNALVSSTNTAGTIALFVALHEAYYYGKAYALRTVANARCLAQALFDRGFAVLEPTKGFTSVHQLFVDVRPIGAGAVVLDRLVSANISANRTIAFEHIDALRLGVQEITRYGFAEDDLQRIADLLVRLLLRKEDPRQVRAEIVSLVRLHRTVQYCEPEERSAYETETGATEIFQLGKWPARASKADVCETDPLVGLDRAPCRWIDVRLELESIAAEIPHATFEAMSELGQLIGGVEGQLDSSGNLSFSRDGNIYVTAAGVFIRELAAQDFVRISDLSENVLVCKGLANPSAEALMHYLVYAATDAQVVVHFHLIADAGSLPNDVAVTGPHEYGSLELAEGVAGALSKNNIVYIRSHGFVIAGMDLADCRASIVRLFAILSPS